VPAPGAFTRRPGRLMVWMRLRLWPGTSAPGDALSASDKLRQRQLKRRRELDEIAVARVSQPALDVPDVGPVHPGKIGQPLLGEAADFFPPCSYRLAKSL
jgi:hypothetical protein